MPQQAIACFSKNKARHLETLASLIGIPSISFAGFEAAPMAEAAAALTALCKALGFEVQSLGAPGAPPCLVAHRQVAEGLPTVALYAHYDVQPPGEASLWKSPPFVATLREGRLYGRGTADDKGGILVHLAAIEAWLAAQHSLPLNIKLIFDGEEEIGSPGLEALLHTQPGQLAADALVIMDAGNLETGLPALTTSLRGIFCMDIEVQVAQSSLHSGLWGGPVPDAAMALSKMLASLVNEEGQPLLEGPFRPLAKAEEEALAKLPFKREAFAQQAGLLPGVQSLGGEGCAGSPWRQNWYAPSLSINAFEASSRAQARNVLNSHAYARISIRTVPELSTPQVEEWLEKRLRAAAPWGVHLTLKGGEGCLWWRMDADSPPAQAALRALTRGFGREALAIGCGASIPLANQWAHTIGATRPSPILLVGVVDAASATHAENESLHLGDWEKAVLSEIHLFDELKTALKP
ncbi:MAG: M20/M25/M40 family metallo-hydrolase [Cystobacterineae bacterium]|nr:M20/M25/M40 family metallo-hydrolase [Cystobacterineae bacterium]